MEHTKERYTPPKIVQIKNGLATAWRNTTSAVRSFTNKLFLMFGLISLCMLRCVIEKPCCFT